MTRVAALERWRIRKGARIACIGEAAATEEFANFVAGHRHRTRQSCYRRSTRRNSRTRARRPEAAPAIPWSSSE